MFDETTACYITGEKINFIQNTFQLNEQQENELKSYVSKCTPEELHQHHYSMRITEKQKESILAFHQNLMNLLKKYFNVETDEELAERLIAHKFIIFSAHALNRLQERFNAKNVSPENPFYALSKYGSSSPEDLQQESVEVLVAADQVENKVEWRDDPFCVINYSVDGDKTVMSVATNFVPELENQFIVVTVMSKNDKSL